MEKRMKDEIENKYVKPVMEKLAALEERVAKLEKPKKAKPRKKKA